MDGNNLGILLTYNVSCPWWTKIAKIYRRNWEELLKHRTLMSKSAKKTCTLRDVAGKQTGRMRYFLEAQSQTAGKSLVLKGNISKVIRPGTLLINKIYQNRFVPEMPPWLITYSQKHFFVLFSILTNLNITVHGRK